MFSLYEKFIQAQERKKQRRRLLEHVKKVLSGTFKGVVREIYINGPNRGRYRVDIYGRKGEVIKDVICDVLKKGFAWFGLKKRESGIRQEEIHVGSVVGVQFNTPGRADIVEIRGSTVQEEREVIEQLKKTELKEDIKERMAFMLDEGALGDRVGKISLLFEGYEFRYPKLPIYELPKEKILLKRRK